LLLTHCRFARAFHCRRACASTRDEYSYRLATKPSAAEEPADLAEELPPDLSREPEDIEQPLDDEDRKRVQKDLDKKYRDIVTQMKMIIYPEVRDPEAMFDLPKADRDCLDSASPPDWLDGWCMLLGHAPVAGARYGDLWSERIAVYDAKNLWGTKHEVRESEVGWRRFNRSIEQHAAQARAFLVSRLELALPAQSLEVLDVEDLPGVGNFDDPASNVALEVLTDAMRSKSLDGLLVVVRGNGLEEDTGRLLRAARVLERVLDKDTDLGIAVTHIEEGVTAARKALRRDRVEKSQWPSSDELFLRASRRAAARNRRTLRALLEDSVAHLDEDERRSLVDHVMDRTSVVGVEGNAAEAFVFDREEDVRVYTTNLRATRVPELLDHFRARARKRHVERLTPLQKQTELIGRGILAELARIARANAADEGMKLQAAQRIAYVGAMTEAKHSLSNRWTAIRERVEMRLQYKVQHPLEQARLRAERKARLRKAAEIELCRTVGTYNGYTGYLVHWTVLQAALRRGGIYVSTHRIDLPGDLAREIHPELQQGWKNVASQIRALFDEYHDNANKLLDSLETAAKKAASESGVTPDIEAIKYARRGLQDSLQALRRSLSASIGVATDRMKDVLRERLLDHFEIECEKVIARTPRGNGWTRRALREFERVGESAIIEGSDVGIAAANEELDRLRRKIREGVLSKDPIGPAFQKLIEAAQDAVESAELAEARGALVEWAKDASAQFQTGLGADQ